MTAGARADNGSAPAGNNGTIKIDETPIDAGHDNDPHVGCAFSLELFGYDAGQNSAQVTFAAQAPTGSATLLTDTFSFDGAGRSQGGATFDTARAYDLTAAMASMQPAHEGFHVKVSVGVDGWPAKHKVFWVQGCRPASPAAAAATSAAPPAVGATTASHTVTGSSATSSSSRSSTAAAVLATSAAAPTSVAHTATGPQAEVLGLSITRSQPAAVSGLSSTRTPSGTLPSTGVAIVSLVLAGVAAIGGGISLRHLARRRAAAS